jgi:hypothetical protein
MSTAKLAIGTFIVVAWLTCGTVLVYDKEKEGLKRAENFNKYMEKQQREFDEVVNNFKEDMNRFNDEVNINIQ